jgi:hypothetical protein
MITQFETISKNIEGIRYLSSIGWTSTTVLNHWYIYSRLDYYRRLNKSVCEAAFLVSEELKISEMSTFRSKKLMEEQLKNNIQILLI